MISSTLAKRHSRFSTSREKIGYSCCCRYCLMPAPVARDRFLYLSRGGAGFMRMCRGGGDPSAPDGRGAAARAARFSRPMRPGTLEQGVVGRH